MLFWLWFCWCCLPLCIAFCSVLAPPWDKSFRGQKVWAFPPLDLVDSLQQIEYANAITVDNGVDAMYKKLNMEIEPLPKSDADYKLVAKMVNNTHGKSHGHFTLELTNVFRLRKETQEKKFAAVGGKINNHMLLWHGSRLTNWCGILSQGLRIAPPEAPVTGYMPVKETIPDPSFPFLNGSSWDCIWYLIDNM